ncbi:RNA polymerase sigma factor [Fibrella aquatilis]|uniref:Sigma-70 family RNA polymerase sigma factor n=1 Tax=Fibrella aquatilis TaxID=2817059 RepID=A0A939G108_9BACT|nr:sigma-70 family RNA polymerase sigma factor [Fibrella aquatilis]MBO0929989.1 sigma-70 family RNA polymerase sigma factor [Fibrella aquatilis]
MPAEKPKRTILATVKQYSGRLFGFIRDRVRTEEDAEDILQDVWYQLSRVVDLDQIGSLSGWLYEVARNRITDRYRRTRETAFSDAAHAGDNDEDDSLSLGDLLLADPDAADDPLFRDLIWDELMRALDELPENQRTVFIQNELEDKTLQAIADQTGENLKTIISRKRYAVQHLRRRLQTLYNDLSNT